MSIKIFTIMTFAGVLFISCTNPELKSTPEETKAAGVLKLHQTSSTDKENYDESSKVYSSIELDRLSQTPIEVSDSSENKDDMTVAIDDYIWRELSIAHDYYTMGVIANRETSWEEAQYYFEKGLSLLADLDIDTEADSLSPEAAKYSVLLTDIFANYKTTLLSLGHLPSDVSSDALMSRFSEINHIKIDSSEFKRLEAYAAEKVSYNVPIILNERVKKSLLYYQTVARDPVERYLARSTKFIPMIDSIFTAMGVPTDIKYLAMVESGYSPYAYSRARAMGLWQFIASTGRMYDMRRTWWYDERRDPVKATVAAARFLTDLYNKFGSWELAMAAYNGGPGRVGRQIKKQKTKDFWKLDLRKQTEDYVPFFMAATMIGKNPEKFGFTDIDYQSEWVYDLVEIEKCLDLKTIAKAIGCSVTDLKALNPELLRRFTPPDIKKYPLRIPQGSRDKFLAAYNSMPTSKETSFVRHKIKRGETVSTIARKYGVSQLAILGANNLSRRSKIYTGKSLVIPVPNDKSYARSQKKEYKSDGNVYVVRSGDTVWDIARAFGTSTSKIRRLNSLDRRSRIYVGQRLKIGTEMASAESNSKYAKNDSKQKSSGSKKSKNTYVVKKGDSLWKIANRFGTTTTAIKKLNGMGRSSRIYPGQKLMVTGSDSSGNAYLIYTVKRGDTMSGIADLYKVPVNRLMAWNNVINPRGLKVGSKLKIYSN